MPINHQAALVARLKASGGKRISINLPAEAVHTIKLLRERHNLPSATKTIIAALIFDLANSKDKS
jgi:hypothetical protein